MTNHFTYMGILRGITPVAISPLAEVCAKVQLPSLEITMNTEKACDLIAEMKHNANKRFKVGAGTVLSMAQLHDARAAGAEFIVMPVIIPEIIKYCNDKNIPVFPGALTPNEIFAAWHAGATMVKVFPASVFGPAYFKEVKAPLNTIELLACGGVSVTTIADYFKNGASAVAFGASVFRKDWIAENRFDLIENEIRQLIAAVQK